jgi:hypothetical protein
MAYRARDLQNLQSMFVEMMAWNGFAHELVSEL